MKKFLCLLLISMALSLHAQVADGPAEEKDGELKTEPAGPAEAGQSREEPAAADAANADFQPSEEISEDFPVPLPADI